MNRPNAAKTSEVIQARSPVRIQVAGSISTLLIAPATYTTATEVSPRSIATMTLIVT